MLTKLKSFKKTFKHMGFFYGLEAPLKQKLGKYLLEIVYRGFPLDTSWLFMFNFIRWEIEGQIEDDEDIAEGFIDSLERLEYLNSYPLKKMKEFINNKNLKVRDLIESEFD